MTREGSVAAPHAAPSILVVDDNPSNLKLLSALLSLDGYAVHAATKAEDALDILRRHSPALVLTDVGLPDLSGIELTRRIKSDPGTRHIPVVCLASSEERQEADAARELGCSDFLVKPINTRTLPDLVKSLLRSARRPG